MNKKILITAMTAFTLVLTACGGSEHNRDHNAAINLKKEAQRLALI